MRFSIETISSSERFNFSASLFNWFLSDLSILLPGDLVDVPKKSFPKDFYLEGMQWFTVNYQKASQSNYQPLNLNFKHMPNL